MESQCGYEIDLYKITKTSASIVDSRRIKTNKPINCNEVSIIKRRDYKLLIFITPLENG